MLLRRKETLKRAFICSHQVSHFTLTWLTYVCRVTKVSLVSVVYLALLDPLVSEVPPDLLEMTVLR